MGVCEALFWSMWIFVSLFCSPNTRRRMRERHVIRRSESPERRAFQPPGLAPQQIHPAVLPHQMSHHHHHHHHPLGVNLQQVIANVGIGTGSQLCWPPGLKKLQQSDFGFNFQVTVSNPITMAPYGVSVCTGAHHLPVCTGAHMPVCTTQSTWSLPGCGLPIPSCTLPACGLPVTHPIPPLLQTHPPPPHHAPHHPHHHHHQHPLQQQHQQQQQQHQQPAQHLTGPPTQFLPVPQRLQVCANSDDKSLNLTEDVVILCSRRAELPESKELTLKPGSEHLVSKWECTCVYNTYT